MEKKHYVTFGEVIGLVKAIPGSATADAIAAKEIAETAAAAAAARAFAVEDDGSGLVFTPPESEE